MSLRIDPRPLDAALARLRAASALPVCAYVYDLDALHAHARWMRALLPAPVELFYAIKANPEPALLDTLSQWCDGFEAASGGELAWLRRHQPGKPLLFGGPGKLVEDLRVALALPDCTLHVESLGELERIARLVDDDARHAMLCLRINLAPRSLPRTRLMMGGGASPFGLDPSDLEAALDRLAQRPRLRLTGFHFHLLSHQCDARAQLRLLGDCLDAVRQWQDRHGLGRLVVNGGGGFGVAYRRPAGSFDWSTFCAGLPPLLDRNRDALRLRLEPGRYVSAACGWYLMEVLDIKRSHGQWFAIGHGGTHHFRTPAAQGHDHPFLVIRGGQPPACRDVPVTVVGQLCTPKDVLARAQPVAALAPGDVLAFPLAGAYAWNISHRDFLMHPPPRRLFVGTGAEAFNTPSPPAP